MSSPRPNRGWLWYMLIIGVIGVVFVGGLFATTWWPEFFHLPSQLKPEELARNEEKWRQHGPRDYDLVYTKDGSANGTFEVEVRRGRVVRALADGRPLEPRLYAYSSMQGLFDDVDGFLRRTQEPGTRRYLRAWFDPEDGHLSKYVYHDPATYQTVVVEVKKLQSVAPPNPSP